MERGRGKQRESGRYGWKENKNTDEGAVGERSRRERVREGYLKRNREREASQQCIHRQEVLRRGWLALPSHQPPHHHHITRPLLLGKAGPQHTRAHTSTVHLRMLAQPKIHLCMLWNELDVNCCRLWDFEIAGNTAAIRAPHRINVWNSGDPNVVWWAFSRKFKLWGKTFFFFFLFSYRKKCVFWKYQPLNPQPREGP